QNHKSPLALVHTLARAASVGANLLLNVGPTALGEILPIHAERLRAVGEWLALHGETIYATRAGVIPPSPSTSSGGGWSTFVSTCRGETHYLHLLHYLSDCITLPDLPEVTHATWLKIGRASCR